MSLLEVPAAAQGHEISEKQSDGKADERKQRGFDE